MDELTKQQVRELYQSLLLSQKDMLQLLQDTHDEAKPVSLDEPIGRLARMDALQQQSMALANRQTALRRLERIESALRRHAQDEYGFCQSCEEPIGYARLKAQPEAPFCVDCQGHRETRGT